MPVKHTISLLLVPLALCGCGPMKNKALRGGGASLSLTDPGRESVSIPLAVVDASGAKGGPAYGFAMTLEGCASGLSFDHLSEARPQIDVYRDDRGCIVKLKSFTVAGVSYLPSAADPFGSWFTGDTATFEESGHPLRKMQVSVTSQLKSPIAGMESVTYSVSRLGGSGEGSNGKASVSAGISLSNDAAEAPPLTVLSTRFLGIAADGGGQFVFTIECGEELGGTAPGLTCAGFSLDTLRYRLIKDSFGGSLNLAAARSLFDGSELGIDSQEKLLPGQGGTSKGGFVTHSGALVLSGPAQMQQNPKMILVVQIGSSAYRYFTVDASTLAYP